MKIMYPIFWLTILIVLKPLEITGKQPHIVFILADDLGWNDVGFHGSGDIRTPNIDALAYSGLILNRYYVTPICTPSRSALMTGKYPIHTGMQHGVIYGAEPRGLPLDEKILPEYLNEMGYTSHIVGKWHLGSFKQKYLPTERGFESHLGYWTGHQDYFDHTAMEQNTWGFDMRRNLELSYDLHGSYSTDVFTEESINIIKKHDSENPLFLYIAHAAVHSANPYNPLPAPDETVEKFSNIGDYKRQRFAAMLSKLDDSVGMVVDALEKQKMLNDTIIIFSTDNGGPAAGFNINAASNYPLRGVKNTLWEGGVRGAAFIWSSMIKTNQRIVNNMLHITDWLPTLLAAAGLNSSLTQIDGIDQWGALSNNEVAPRQKVLHNIDDIIGNAAVTVWPLKLMKGTSYEGTWDSWYGPSGRDFSYNTSAVINSVAGSALKNIGVILNTEKIDELRNNSTIACIQGNSTCNLLQESCLFNILQDPCEVNNIAKQYPQSLKDLEKVLQEYNKTAVTPNNMPLDPRGDPKFWNYTWTNFGDLINI